MKLSKKGLERVSEPILKFVDGYYDYAIVETLEDHEFEPDDFQGAVILSLEEAKEIIGTYIGTNCEIVKQHGIPELKIKNPSWLIHLLERIEQAEKKDAND